MARVAKSVEVASRTGRGRKPLGRPASASAKTAGRAPSTVRATAAPKLSKDELRAQVEKLERANEKLRAKSREANRDAKSSAARIAELEGEVARLEKKAASQAAAAGRDSKSRAAPRSKRQSSSRDPGDAVPPGVAVEEPTSVDADAEAARDNLDKQLGGE